MDQDQEPGGELPEEPQSERGPMGSRDKGGPPGSGPVDRPAGTSGPDDSTGVDPQEPQEGAPTLPAGDQGPAPGVGGPQEPGGPVPPYEGRRESAEIDAGGADRDGVHVGGATGPRIASSPPDDPASTPLDRTASPAEDADGTEVAGYEADPGVGPAHQAGVNKAEDEPE